MRLADGTTHVIFEPLDFIARLAALVPKPRANLSVDLGEFALRYTTIAAGPLESRGSSEPCPYLPVARAQRWIPWFTGHECIARMLSRPMTRH